MGIEPTSSAWKAEVLPLNYTRQYQSLLSLRSASTGKAPRLCGLPPWPEANRYRRVPSLFRPRNYLRAAVECSLLLRIFALLDRSIVPAGYIDPPPPERVSGGGGRIRTYVGVSQQIYSLPPLTAWVPLRECKPAIFGLGEGHVNTRPVLSATGRAAAAPGRP